MVGQNEKPESKIADFERLMDSGLARTTDVAFFKFCYIDFNGAWTARCSRRYRASMEGLKARHPNTAAVHHRAAHHGAARSQGVAEGAARPARVGHRQNLCGRYSREVLVSSIGEMD